MEDIKKQLQKLDKLDNIEEKIDNVDRKMTSLDMKLMRLDAKVGDVDDRLKVTEANVERISQSEKDFQLAGRKCEIAQIISEYNTRQYNVTFDNVLMHGEYEDKGVSVQKVQHILSNILKIPDANKIIIADAHRLPSANESGRKSLIFKLVKMTDKTKIWDHLEELKAWNQQCETKDKLYVNMTNLPAKLARDRKELLDNYKHARNNGLKPKWRFLKNVMKNQCEYGYKIGSTFYGPKNDNFNFKLKMTVADIVSQTE